MPQSSLMDRLNNMQQDADVGNPPPVDAQAEEAPVVSSSVYLQSKSPSYGGFFGNSTRRFQFRNYRLKTTREDADYILQHHSTFVHEVPSPEEM